MKVISLNLNGIRSAVRKGLIKWIEKQQADLICFQETKAQIQQLTTIMSSFQDWHTAFSDAEKKGYSGVAIFSKKPPQLISKSFGFREADREGRFIQFDFEKLSIVSVYFPSGSSGMERQDMKYRFMEEFEKWLNSRNKDLKKIIICGDLNIAHNEIDLKNWKGNKKNSGFLPEERAWLSKVFKKYNLFDAYRTLYPNAEEYTWWSNRGKAWDNNVGWRIDYQVVGSDYIKKIKSAEIYRTERFSDHAPLVISYDD